MVSAAHSMKRLLPFFIIILVALAAAAEGLAVYRIEKAALAAVPRATPAEGAPVVYGAKPPHVRGREEEASVVIEEFGDFQCPPCGVLAGFLDKMQEEYRTKLVLVYREFPLAMHEHAMQAALAAEAAGMQNRFWEMHHLLYENQSSWARSAEAQSIFDGYAEQLHLDTPRYKNEVAGEVARSRIAADQDRAKSLGVTGTPALFLNDERVPTAEMTPEGLRRAIEAAVAGRKPIFKPADDEKRENK